MPEPVLVYLFSRGKYLRRTTGILKESILTVEKRPVVFFSGWTLINSKGKKICFVDNDLFLQLPLDLKINEDIARTVLKAKNWSEGTNDAKKTFYTEKEGLLKEILKVYLPLILEALVVLGAFMTMGNWKVTCVIK
jgi:hypothetical protein